MKRALCALAAAVLLAACGGKVVTYTKRVSVAECSFTDVDDKGYQVGEVRYGPCPPDFKF